MFAVCVSLLFSVSVPCSCFRRPSVSLFRPLFVLPCLSLCSFASVAALSYPRLCLCGSTCQAWSVPRIVSDSLTVASGHQCDAVYGQGLACRLLLWVVHQWAGAVLVVDGAVHLIRGAQCCSGVLLRQVPLLWGRWHHVLLWLTRAVAGSCSVRSHPAGRLTGSFLWLFLSRAGVLACFPLAST